MAKIKKTEREKRWDRVWNEFIKTQEDPDNDGGSDNRCCAAVAAKLKIPLSTVRLIVSRMREKLNE